jgi:hydrogenase/urease accessory protein HupE
VRAILFRFALLLATLVMWPKSAVAHAIGLSTGEYRRTPDGLAVELVFARSELASLAYADVVGKIHVDIRGRDCAGDLVDASPTDRDAVRLRARYRCLEVGAPLRVRIGLFDDLSHGHRHAARVVSGDRARDELCFKQHAELDVPELTAAPDAPRPSAFGFVRMGFEHILSGYDHLVFLFALVLVGGRLRSLLGVVTAFTVAHSLTLALAVLGVWSPSPRVVEPLIALSIAYVGIENLAARDFDTRWRITFPFGLVHGFGFAGALADVGLTRSEVPAALVAFNVGVELGQLAVLALLLPLAWRLGRWEPFRRRIVPAFSLCVVAAGAAWFVERAVGGLPPAPVAQESSITAGS